MPELQNPFAYDAANNLDPELVLAYYIDDHNYTRLIQSRRNIFLVGERGSGKTMTLLYNTLRVQQLKAQREDVEIPLDLVGVLVPCNTPLIHKREYKLLDDFMGSVVSEHFLTLAIAFAIADTLSAVPHLLAPDEDAALKEEMEFLLGLEMPQKYDFFEALKLAIQREIGATQRQMNNPESDLLYDQALSFASFVLPLLGALRRVPKLSNSHFMLMIDDAHDLNEHQIKALNSWIAYRDRSAFSFKVATAKVGRPLLVTGSGGSILEGHDYITVDMEGPLHNDESNFGKLARKIVAKRLSLIGVECPPDEFFPLHPEFAQDLEEAEERVRQRAAALLPNGTSKQIADYVYKQRRAEYFRSRAAKANLPPYSGFSTLVYISTGVVRNLLEPCFWMFDDAISALSADDRAEGGIHEIPPNIQAARILDRSRAAWKRLKELDKSIQGCSPEMAWKVHALFNNLAIFFRERLLKHTSEPGATSFTISQQTPEVMERLAPLLEVAQKAQMLYVREGSSKDDGRREDYYVPNRILWPIRGLDPFGQHARASIKAIELLAASEGHAIPPRVGEDDPQPQGELFYV